MQENRSLIPFCFGLLALLFLEAGCTVHTVETISAPIEPSFTTELVGQDKLDSYSLKLHWNALGNRRFYLVRAAEIHNPYHYPLNGEIATSAWATLTTTESGSGTFDDTQVDPGTIYQYMLIEIDGAFRVGPIRKRIPHDLQVEERWGITESDMSPLGRVLFPQGKSVEFAPLVQLRPIVANDLFFAAPSTIVLDSTANSDYMSPLVIITSSLSGKLAVQLKNSGPLHYFIWSEQPSDFSISTSGEIGPSIQCLSIAGQKKQWSPTCDQWKEQYIRTPEKYTPPPELAPPTDPSVNLDGINLF